MALESLSDKVIGELLTAPKKLKNPMSKTKNNEGHEQHNFNVISLDSHSHIFEIYMRKNLREGMEDDFSCGISWISPSGETVTLKRYNGSSHNHPNHLEQTSTGYNTHIHIATERYIKANKKPEGFAEVTDRYSSVEGALHCLVKDCNITGIKTDPDNLNQISLFDQ